MRRSRLDAAETGPYGHLLQRLALALEEVDTASHLHREPPVELELSGLSRAELELIRAYTERDLPWLRGWHAAAEELAQAEPRSLRPPAEGRQPLKTSVRRPLLARKRQPLSCALCGSLADWKYGKGAQACKTCGSQLFRAGNPR
ncbi:hypothetical protein [Pseudomonas sp. N040]|uniref:hypothetical protein n=1 Tax=Pseudomonas sp. N040 TaxID=2785325 RepID=UPI0018A32A36|nr:hypothetical protein [Pseudomonas sp. N040]MBF7730917.1 hypothetical protein [Pseudomonas sp. N040]MBW7014560.1 hypothetical protein [Pseudomonas sp. N040]